tara:strand:- start:2280 stop:2456 length:177 start_codon:yes stop_codon:yes gene_type:complete
MKQALSWILYYLGDMISRTILRYGYGYGLYKTLMLWSVDLDDKFDVWKEVKPKRRKKK